MFMETSSPFDSTNHDPAAFNALMVAIEKALQADKLKRLNISYASLPLPLELDSAEYLDSDDPIYRLVEASYRLRGWRKVKCTIQTGLPGLHPNKLLVSFKL